MSRLLTIASCVGAAWLAVSPCAAQQPPYTCDDVRAALHRYGRERLEAMARAAGATEEQRRQVVACVRHGRRMR